MPLFEYVCRSCAKKFEVLVRGAESPACPACHGTDLEKLHSTFAVAVAGAGPRARSEMEPASPCASCGDPNGPCPLRN